MKKNNKITMTLLLAAVFAIAAGIGIFMMLSPRFTTFYTFKQAYGAGTVLTANMLVPVEASSNIVVAGARGDAAGTFVTSSTVQQIINRGEALKTDVSAGMPLMSSMLNITGGSSIEMSMTPSKIAITVETNDIRGVTQELDAGSNVNVYVVVEGKSYLVFENMRLLEVSRDNGGSLKAVTLELTNQEAELMLDAMAAGKIYFGLVNGSGYQYSGTAAIDSVLQGKDKAAAEPVTQNDAVTGLKTENTNGQETDTQDTETNNVESEFPAQQTNATQGQSITLQELSEETAPVQQEDVLVQIAVENQEPAELSQNNAIQSES